MDHNFTKLIKQWLDTPDEQRDYTVGALYLLKLNGNTLAYRNVIANIEGRKEFVVYNLQKYYDFRVQQLTHDEVAAMAAEVEVIAEKHQLSEEPAPSEAENGHRSLGKRPDHDSLPDDIIAKYVENLSILQKMRELHLRLRTLSLDNVTCPDSERYPFLKELIKLDKQLHANWEAYDHYVADAPKKTTRKKKEATASQQ